MNDLVASPGGPPGIAVIVHRGHHPRFHAAGTSNVETGARWRRTDYMRLASTSKAFTGATALALVRRHKLRLNDSVGEALPSLPKAWAKVTLAQLLQHTSGVPSYTASKRFRQTVGEHPHRRWHPRELLRFVQRKPLKFRPGSKYEYSNSDNIVAGLMIARATGHSYLHELRRLVLRPLGLGETSLPAGPELPHPYVHGYDVSGAEPEDLTHLFAMSGAWASGGMTSSPRDLDRFIRADVSGRLAGRRASRHQLSFVRGGGDPLGPGKNWSGLSIYRYRTSCGTVFGHTGNIPGFTQFAAASRDGRRSVTVSLNTAVSEGGTGTPEALHGFRRVMHLAVCAALR